MTKEQYKRIVLNSPFGFLYLKDICISPFKFAIMDANDKFLSIIGEKREVLFKKSIKELEDFCFFKKLRHMLDMNIKNQRIYFERTKSSYTVRIVPNKKDIAVYLIEDTIKIEENNIACDSAINAIIKTLSAKCPREEAHSKRVSALCEKFAKAMNFHIEEIDKLRLAGLMHDVGKVAVNDEILDKPASLTQEEWIKMKRHPQMGYSILGGMKELKHLAEVVYQHHERWDGKGYPQGLKAEEIIKEARIISIADAYDSMTNDRPYRKAKKVFEAVRILKENAAKQFDPKLCRFFVEKVLGYDW